MLVDAQLELSDSQAVTASAVSTNSIDLGLAGLDVGAGKPLYFVIGCTVAMTDAGSDSTVTVTIVDDDNGALSSAATLQTIGTFAATSAAGTRLYGVLYPDVINQQYLGVNYAVANGNLTTGSFDAFVTTDIDQFVAYANGYTIS